jgi:hypothetical protein
LNWGFSCGWVRLARKLGHFSPQFCKSACVHLNYFLANKIVFFFPNKSI